MASILVVAHIEKGLNSLNMEVASWKILFCSHCSIEKINCNSIRDESIGGQPINALGIRTNDHFPFQE